MDSDYVMPDWDRGRLYVKDREAPDGVMVFSLETGEHLTTVQVLKGEGPFEIADQWRGMALAGDGGLYIAGDRRVITYDSSFQPIGTWTPRAPPRWAVCELGGKPAVPIQGGVLRHELEAIGPSAVVDTILDSKVSVRSVEEAGARALVAGLEMMSTRMICTDDMAIVVTTYRGFQGEGQVMSNEGPDSVFIYRLDGTMNRVAVPGDYVDADCVVSFRLGGQKMTRPCRPWNARLNPSFDGRGNLVLSGSHREIAGVIIDMDTGCYALVRKYPGTRDEILDEDADMHIRMVGVRGDSALMFHNDRGTAADGRPTYFSNSAVKVSLHPVRTVSDDPCAGMLAR